ncbi:MAG: beta-galactosidase, partial [Tepidisphaeraceae bacterium]
MNTPNLLRAILVSLLGSVSVAAAPPGADNAVPHLRKQGTATQLIVDGQPFVMLAGELHNSSASGVEYIKTLWPKLGELGLNTVLAPVSWELIEPREGEFDFTLVDALLEQARMHRQRLVLLWFGSWKNGVSSYAPRWVLQDTKRFRRAQGSSNHNTKDILTPLSETNR